MGCRTDERLSEGLPLTQDTIPDRPQALVSPEAEKKVVNPKTALLYQYLAIRMLEQLNWYLPLVLKPIVAAVTLDI